MLPQPSTAGVQAGNWLLVEKQRRFSSRLIKDWSNSHPIVVLDSSGSEGFGLAERVVPLQQNPLRPKRLDSGPNRFRAFWTTFLAKADGFEPDIGLGWQVLSGVLESADDNPTLEAIESELATLESAEQSATDLTAEVASSLRAHISSHRHDGDKRGLVPFDSAAGAVFSDSELERGVVIDLSQFDPIATSLSRINLIDRTLEQAQRINQDVVLVIDDPLSIKTGLLERYLKQAPEYGVAVILRVDCAGGISEDKLSNQIVARCPHRIVGSEVPEAATAAIWREPIKLDDGADLMGHYVGPQQRGIKFATI